MNLRKLITDKLLAVRHETARRRKEGGHHVYCSRSLLGSALLALAACGDGDDGPTGPSPEDLAEGKEIFRFDTFGDETFWTDTLRLHEVIQTAVSPLTALGVGLKVDADALPPGTLENADLNDPRPRSHCSSSMRSSGLRARSRP